MPDACCAPHAPADDSHALLSRAAKKLLKPFASPAPDVVWALTAARLPCWIRASPLVPAARPHAVFIIQLEPGPPRMLHNVVDPSLWGPPHHLDALPPLDKVLEAAAAAVREADECPGKLLCLEAAYVHAMAPLLAPRGVCVAPASAAEAAAVAVLLKAETESLAKRVVSRLQSQQGVRAFMAAREPTLRESSPALRDAHLRAFYGLSNELTSVAPWEKLDERVLLRVRFPGGAAPAPGYEVPPGEVMWCAIAGLGFFQAVQNAMQQRQNLQLREPPRIGINVFYRRADAENFLLAPLSARLAAMRAAGQLRVPVELPLTARACALDSRCLVCGAPGKRCARCVGVSYCGEACQKANWLAHKPVCVAPLKPALGVPPPAQMTSPFISLVFVEAKDAPLGDLEDMGRCGGAPLRSMATPWDCDEVPVPMLFTKGQVSRPPLLDLVRLMRVLGAVSAFLRDNIVQASLPIAMTEEVAVPFAHNFARAPRVGASGACPSPPPPPPHTHTSHTHARVHPAHAPPPPHPYHNPRIFPFPAEEGGGGSWFEATGEKWEGAGAEAGGVAYVSSDYVCPEHEVPDRVKTAEQFTARCTAALSMKDEVLQFRPPPPRQAAAQ